MTSTALAESQRSINRLELIVEGAPEAIVMANGDGIITLVNARTEQMFGYARTDLLGKPIELPVPKQPRAMGAGRELYGVRKDGVEVPIEIGLNPVESTIGKFALASIIDLSKRRHQQQELRRSNAELVLMNRELDEFVYAASYDLRAPLTVVASLAQWILIVAKIGVGCGIGPSRGRGAHFWFDWPASGATG
jgi:PAS domain S-box-containing protein